MIKRCFRRNGGRIIIRNSIIKKRSESWICKLVILRIKTRNKKIEEWISSREYYSYNRSLDFGM